MENAIQEAEEITEEINESTDSDGNIIEQALDKLAGGVSGLLDKGEQILNQFIKYSGHVRDILPDSYRSADVRIVAGENDVRSADRCTQRTAEEDSQENAGREKENDGGVGTE